MAASEQYPANAVIVNENGSVTSLEGPSTDGALEYLQPIFEASGIELTEVGLYVSEYDLQHGVNMSEFPPINP